jgi:hypothetical protein
MVRIRRMKHPLNSLLICRFVDKRSVGASHISYQQALSCTRKILILVQDSRRLLRRKSKCHCYIAACLVQDRGSDQAISYKAWVLAFQISSILYQDQSYSGTRYEKSPTNWEFCQLVLGLGLSCTRIECLLVQDIWPWRLDPFDREKRPPIWKRITILYQEIAHPGTRFWKLLMGGAYHAPAS